MKYETVIGLEIHAQLSTDSKIFCGCSTKFGAKPNTNICPVCTGQPGVLPVLNKKVVELAIKTAIALNCKIEPRSVFARKHYFYPDLPKDFQISQYELPLATGGSVEIDVLGQKKKIGITRIHLEEDAGKLVHQGADRIMGSESSLVDYNRTGVPLMEIVSEPDIRSPLEAKLFMEELQHLLQFIKVCDAKMEEGSLRCDANISIRPFGQAKFGTKTEVKNMNSFKGVFQALEAEAKRHTEVIEDGGRIIQETRYFDDVTRTTTSMRSKEQAHDYRYFPEPDLVPVEPDDAWINEIKKTLGELPEQKAERYKQEYGLTKADVEVLLATPATATFFEESTKLYNKPKTIANWLMGDINAYLNEHKKSIDEINFTPGQLIDILKLIDNNTVSSTGAKDVLREMFDTGKSGLDIIHEKGLAQVSDEGELGKIIKEVIKNNPKQVEQYKGGKKTVLAFFVGQVMKASKGKANPGLANKLLVKELG